MEFTAITDEQRNTFESEGYLIVRNAVDEDYRNRLIEAGDRLASSDRQEFRSEMRGKHGRDGFRNIVAIDEIFQPLLTLSTTVPLVMQLLGPRIQLHTSHLIWAYPSPDNTPDDYRRPGWHRDIERMTRDLGDDVQPRVEIKVAYYLSDSSTPGCGQTLFVPGSHRLSAPPAWRDGEADPDGAVEPLVHAGDAVLFENRTWHAAGPNISGRTRKTIMFGYSHRWMRPDDYVTQPESLLSRCTDLERSFVEIQSNFDDKGHFEPGGHSYALDDWAEEHGI